MAPSLHSLPTELLEAILKELDPAQLLDVRLVCEELNVKSLHLVGLAHFTTVSLELSSSMTQLEYLATESPFGPYVRTLDITDFYTDSRVKDPLHHSNYFPIIGCLHNLVCLDLTNIDMSKTEFHDLLNSVRRTIKTLIICRICISGSQAGPLVWPDLLRSLVHTLPGLEKINIGILMTEHQQVQRLGFGEESRQLAIEVGTLTVKAENRFHGVRGTFGAIFEGPRMDLGLELLARAAEKGAPVTFGTPQSMESEARVGIRDLFRLPRFHRTWTLRGALLALSRL